MQRIKSFKYLLPTVVFLVFIINIAQSFYTDLLSDEAYYWVYGQYLSWGYFDHPPMVALWITISNFFADGELGVRLFSAVAFSGIIYMVWWLIDHPKKKEFTWLFLLIFLSTSLLNVFGFITTPDTPLTFFLVLFLLAYKKYLTHKNWLSYLLISISIAGMLYSKYQGVLVLFFVALSNLKALKDYKIWLAVLFGLALFFPHLYWQYENDFASVRYHLFERGVHDSYKFRYTYMHFVNAIAIIGFTFPVLYKALFNNLKNKELFNKALNYIVVGFISFFFLMSFKGHVQAQWIVSISIPLIYISFNYLIDNPSKRPLFVKLALVTISIVFYIRVYLVNDKLLPFQLEMHNNKEWVSDLDNKLGDKKALFLNSYQNTSVYWFYSKKRPCQYNSYNSRKNQYELLDFNQKCVGTNMAQIGVKNPYTTYFVKKRKHLLSVNYVDYYHSLQLFSIQFTAPELAMKKGKNTHHIIVENKYTDLSIDSLAFSISVFNEDKKIMKDTIPVKVHSWGKDKNEAKMSYEIKKELFEKIGYIQMIATSNYRVSPQRIGGIIKVNTKNYNDIN